MVFILKCKRCSFSNFCCCFMGNFSALWSIVPKSIILYNTRIGENIYINVQHMTMRHHNGKYSKASYSNKNNQVHASYMYSICFLFVLLKG